MCHPDMSRMCHAAMRINFSLPHARAPETPASTLGKPYRTHVSPCDAHARAPETPHPRPQACTFGVVGTPAPRLRMGHHGTGGDLPRPSEWAVDERTSPGWSALLSSCSRLCRQLHQAVAESSALQRRCAQERFAVSGCEPPARTSWRDAFLHYCRLWRGRPALPARSGRFLSIPPRRRPQP